MEETALSLNILFMPQNNRGAGERKSVDCCLNDCIFKRIKTIYVVFIQKYYGIVGDIAGLKLLTVRAGV